MAGSGEVRSGRYLPSQQEQMQALRDYKLTIEYKHLKQHAPGGVFVIPSFESLRVWWGVIFVRRGHYSKGIFKFRVDLPDEYNGPNTWPKVTFTSRVFNPLVFPQTGELDLKSAYPEWNPERHYMVTVLTFLKKIFYMKSFDGPNPANPVAQNLFHSNKVEFLEEVNNCVRESKENIFKNDPGSSLKFSEPKPAHESLRKSIFESEEFLKGRSEVLSVIEANKKQAEDARNAPPPVPASTETSAPPAPGNATEEDIAI
eukprot:CAMPEP_0113946876 /NCGR_PEP_ID=MMETSP1339-20121228/60793_1 /TAXON_ID=94617 /ORGANISM="Fibrocapsa japonica" /LENGTH=257 /DNA_ID=CAMNT_0000953179 /DNA_START=111 /DNA_END=884 /DNA_ORIENTATION=- /assembly_acc=CAM_ASM_000762